MAAQSEFIPASASSVGIYCLIVLAILIMFFGGVYKASANNIGHRKDRLVISGLVIFAWLTVFGLAVRFGGVGEHPMPRLVLLFVSVNLVSLGLAFSPVGGWLASGLTPGLLIGFHSFRLPLELVLHSWVKQGTIPATMTWTGANWDIAAGILAILIAPFATRTRWLAWAFNIVGLTLLLNVIRTAMMSSPLPFAWQTDPPLLLAMYLPYAFIAPVCVGGALTAHIILFRHLLQKPVVR